MILKIPTLKSTANCWFYYLRFAISHNHQGSERDQPSKENQTLNYQAVAGNFVTWHTTKKVSTLIGNYQKDELFILRLNSCLLFKQRKTGECHLIL